MTFNAIFEGLATAFSAQFGAPYADALARWPGTPTYDAGGSITAPGTPMETPCKAQVDAATEAMRADAGFLQGDARLLVLGLTALDTRADIVIDDDRWSLQTVARDPAGIGWECRARRYA